MLEENNNGQVKLMEANIGFVSFPQLFEIVSDKNITGAIEISWNNNSERLCEWVADGRISPVALECGNGSFLLSNGLLSGAKITSDYTSPEDDEFKILMQLVFGIGCGVLPDTAMTVYEWNDAGQNVSHEKKYNLSGLIKYLGDLEDEFLHQGLF